MNYKLKWALFSTVMSAWCLTGMIVAPTPHLRLINFVFLIVNLTCVIGQLSTYWQRDVSAEKKARINSLIKSIVSE